MLFNIIANFMVTAESAFEAAKKNELRTIKRYKFIDVIDKEGKSLLHYSAEYNTYEVAEYLVHAGVDVDLRDDTYKSPLHYAACFGHVKIVQLLLEHGADINLVGQFGNTALHYACFHGKVRVVRTLIQYEANLNVAAQYNYTPLMIACIHKHYDIVVVLIRAQADINALDDTGCSVLHIACAAELSEVIHILLKCPIKKNIQEMSMYRSPLHVAVRTGCVPIVKMLIESCDFDLNLTDKYGDTIYHYACKRQYQDIIDYLLTCSSLDTSLLNEEGRDGNSYICNSPDTDISEGSSKSDYNRFTILRTSLSSHLYSTFHSFYHPLTQRSVSSYSSKIDHLQNSSPTSTTTTTITYDTITSDTTMTTTTTTTTTAT